MTPLSPEKDPKSVAQVRVPADIFGNNIPCPGQGFVDISRGVIVSHEGCGEGFGVTGFRPGNDHCQFFKALFASTIAPGFPAGFVRKVQILQAGHGIRRPYLLLQAFGE
jgi:hypothetical protein